MYLFVFISWMVSFEVCIYIQYFFAMVRNKLQTITNIYTRVSKKNIKSSRKEHVMRTCFKFWPMKNIFQKLSANESLIMACLQIYRELLLLATFLRVYSNSQEVSYLSWQNGYRNLKTNCHIKLKLFSWAKLLKSLLLAKYLISLRLHWNC